MLSWGKIVKNISKSSITVQCSIVCCLNKMNVYNEFTNHLEIQTDNEIAMTNHATRH